MVNSPDEKVNDHDDIISVKGKIITVSRNIYLILNKPKGYVSSTEDSGPTVIDLVPEKYKMRSIFPAGRLDKDTTGMMIITDDGNFAHRILSPKKHIPKKYFVQIDIPITSEMISGFQSGVLLSDGKTKEAVLEKSDEYSGIISITEGRYHQIKRMFGCYGAKVLELQRISMGGMNLPNDLPLGECRELTEEDLQIIESGVL